MECNKCKKIKPAEDFQGKSTRFKTCLECRQQSKKWPSTNNKDRIAVANQKHKEKVKASRPITSIQASKIGSGIWVEYDSQVEAANALGVYKNNISKVLHGVLKTTGGYVFRKVVKPPPTDTRLSSDEIDTILTDKLFALLQKDLGILSGKSTNAENTVKTREEEYTDLEDLVCSLEAQNIEYEEQLKLQSDRCQELQNMIETLTASYEDKLKSQAAEYEKKLKAQAAEYDKKHRTQNSLEKHIRESASIPSLPKDTSLSAFTMKLYDTGKIKTPLDFAEKFMYLYNNAEGFVVNAEVLVEMGVYDQKIHLKKRGLKHFTVDTDYQVGNITLLERRANNLTSKRGGQNKETIMLTIECFKALCMMPNNEMGKKVRQYYLDLEKVFQYYTLWQHENLLREEKRRYAELERKHDLTLKRRKRSVYERGNVVYIVSSDAMDSYHREKCFKFGKATQKQKEGPPAMMSRMSTYNTGSIENYIVRYIVYVEENTLLETAMKSIWKQYRDPIIKEWVRGISLEKMIETIRDTCVHLKLEFDEASSHHTRDIEMIDSECDTVRDIESVATLDDVSV